MESKHNKSLKYMQHHHLKNIFNIKNSCHIFLMSAGLTLVLGFFSAPYHYYLKSFDFISSIIFIFYLFYLRPRIYRGSIIAYYKKRYVQTYRNVARFCGVYAICAMARLAVALFFVIKRNNSISEIFAELYHPIITNLTIIISLIVLYIFFFHDRYITIRDYSNEIMYRQKELRMYKDEAIDDLYQKRDKELGITEFQGILYDYDEEIRDSRIKNEKEKKEKKEKEKMAMRRNVRV